MTTPVIRYENPVTPQDWRAEMEHLCAEHLQTPLGDMVAVASSRGLCALEFNLPARQALLKARHKRWFADPHLEWRSSPFIEHARVWMQQYLQGVCTPRIPALDLRGTPFELRVWAELLTIPFGATVSYSCLAARVGCPGGARAVGGASRRNPVSIIVPCHRVIAAGGALTGYGGGIDKKKHLLGHEVLHCEGHSLQHTGVLQPVGRCAGLGPSP